MFGVIYPVNSRAFGILLWLAFAITIVGYVVGGFGVGGSSPIMLAKGLLDGAEATAYPYLNARWNGPVVIGFMLVGTWLVMVRPLFRYFVRKTNPFGFRRLRGLGLALTARFIGSTIVCAVVDRLDWAGIQAMGHLLSDVHNHSVDAGTITYVIIQAFISLALAVPLHRISQD
jgi:hypothetical protein